MRSDINKYELIEQYLNNLLSANERSEIDARINSDPGFAFEVEQQRKIQNIITEKSFLDIREELGKIHHNHIQKTRFSRKVWRWGLSGIIIPVVFIPVILINKSQDSKEKPNEIYHLNSAGIDSVSYDEQPEEKTIRINLKDTLHKNTTPPQIQNQSDKTLETGWIDTAKQQANTTVVPVVSKNKDELLKNNPVSENTEIKPDNQEMPVIKEYPQVKENIKTTEKDCDNVAITSDIDLEKSCSDRPTGKIIIKSESIEGGEPPYTVSINKSDFYSQFIFETLKMGNYTITIRDKNDCKSTQGSFFIESFDCTYEYAFAPDKGEIWEIPVQEKSGVLKIFTKSGQLIYNRDIEPDLKYEWTGRTNNGEELPMGAYIFIIEFRNQRSFNGIVTIIR